MTETEALDLLERACTPTRKALAQRLGISQQYLADVLVGRRDPVHVLARFGIVRVYTYEHAKSAQVPA